MMLIPKIRKNKQKIFESPEEFQKYVRTEINFQNCYEYEKIIMTSGGFDPIHPGHITYLQDAKRSRFFHVVVVNGDNFLTNKKGKPFMDLDTRAKIVSAIVGVDAVVKFEIENDQTVIEALKIISPYSFYKGGDRKDKDSLPEWDICEKLGINVVFGVGEEKTQSSSNFINGNPHGTK